MLSDDVYRAKLATTFAALKQRAAALGDVALVEAVATPHFVKIALVPHAANACAVEIMVRGDQRYDIAVATEFYEDCVVDDLGLFELLMTAITRGDLVQRRHLARATGAERAIETIVHLSGGAVWRQGHTHPDVAKAIDDRETVFADRTFVPYRRA
jgi:hypothetical protein